MLVNQQLGRTKRTKKYVRRVRGWWGAAGVSMSYKITLQSSYLDTDTFHPTATLTHRVRARPFSVIRAWGFQP